MRVPLLHRSVEGPNGPSTVRPLLLALAVAALVCVSLTPSVAHGQIKQPGAHTQYSVEIEPHLVLQWQYEPFDDDVGFGPGVRFSIPFLDNGPIQKINNNMAIGFGLDWAHFGDDCDDRYFFRDPYDPECTANVFWFPIVLQWNFFLTPNISVFGEPGFAIAYERWEVSYDCDTDPGFCDAYEVDDADTEVRFMFAGGARFMVSDNVGFTVRLGTPYLSIGASFLL